MVMKRFGYWMAGLAACAAVSPAMADEAADLAAMRAELAAMKAELAQVKAANSATWMDEARQQEIKALVQEVVGDAQNRTAFQEGGLGAGHNGKSFYLEGEGFSLNLSGHVQARYVVNQNDDRAGGEPETLTGFELRRAKLGFSGYIADPKIEYDLVLASERGDGNTLLEDAILSYKYDNGMKISVGRMKIPFLFEELLSSKRQLAVDRSLATEFFTLNRAEGVKLDGEFSDQLKYAVMIHDGGNTEASAATADTVDYAATGRVEYLVMGDWKQYKDLVAFDDDQFLAIGGAAHIESASGAADPTTAFTVDAVYKTGPLSAMGAAMFADDTENSQLGFVAQAGYSLSKEWQPFVRYDFIDSDEDGVDTFNAVTAGVNYYLKGHNAKFTIDGVVVLSEDNPSEISGLNGGEFSSGVGLSSAGTSREQIALRAQFQLLF
jgi:hypothetical protein